jgi:hypothetical protein
MENNNELKEILYWTQIAIIGFNKFELMPYFSSKKINFTPKIYLFEFVNLNYISSDNLEETYINEYEFKYNKKDEIEKTTIILNTIDILNKAKNYKQLIFKLSNKDYLLYNLKDNFYFTFTIKNGIIQKVILNEMDMYTGEYNYKLKFDDIIQTNIKIKDKYIINVFKTLNAERMNYNTYVLNFII